MTPLGFAPGENGFPAPARRYRRMKLRTKLAVGLVVLTLVLSLGTFAGLEFYKDQQVERVQSDVDQTAAVGASQVRSAMLDHRGDLAFAASRVNGSNLTGARDAVGPYLSQSRFFAAYVVDGDAVIVQALGPFNDSEREALVGSPAEIDCVNETLASGEACISDVVSPEGGQPYVVMSAPVFHGNGSVAGALAAPIYVNAETVFSPLATLDTEAQSVRVSAGGETLYESGGGFETTVSATRRVEGHDLRIQIVRDGTGLTQELENLAIAQALGIFLVVLAVVSLGYWEYSVNLSQAERLLRAFDALERGEYDHDPSLRASEEWQQIGAGFTELAGTLKARESALREREQRLGVLNRVMRHNVRNEMTVVLSYTEMLADSLSGEEAEMAGTAAEAGQRLTSLAEQARRIEKTLDGLGDPEPVDLVAIVRSAGSEVATANQGVAFDVDLPEDCWVVGVEELREAVDELLVNAVTHNDADDPWVSVSLERVPAEGEDEVGEAGSGNESENEHAVRLRVADNGPGIPEHERGAIEQGEETALEHASGLGLWLIYWLVDRCDGELRFGESEAGGAAVDCLFRPASPPEED